MYFETLSTVLILLVFLHRVLEFVPTVSGRRPSLSRMHTETHNAAHTHTYTQLLVANMRTCSDCGRKPESLELIFTQTQANHEKLVSSFISAMNDCRIFLNRNDSQRDRKSQFVFVPLSICSHTLEYKSREFEYESDFQNRCKEI